MPRRPRVFVEGLVYHVYNRTGRAEAPFAEDEEARALRDLLAEIKTRDGLCVYAWCIMSNHFHLAVRSGPVPLWRSMRSVQHRYTQRYNRRSQQQGPLWQSRYKAKPVTDQLSLLRVIAYVHLNPVAAGVAADPSDYRWSGHRELLRPAASSLVDADEVMGLLGGSPRGALRAYRALVEKESAEPWIRTSLGRLPWWEAGPETSPRAAASSARRRPVPERSKLPVEELVQRTCSLLGVPADELASPRRSRDLLEARELLAALAIERWGISVRDLSRVLGKSPDGVSRWVQRAAARRSAGEGFAARLDELDQELAAASPAPRS